MSGRIRVFHLPGNESLAAALTRALNAATGELTVRSFPDGESYVRGDTPCDGEEVVLAHNLFRPDDKLLSQIFACKALRVLGARRIVLVTPYLPYMRQDARFQPGEVITSRHFAALIGDSIDALVTVDPHLHRYGSLDEVYAIPTHVARAAPAIADWIRQRVEHPLLIGPDSESRQWVSEVAGLAEAPHLVLEKIRRGDREVEVSVPEFEHMEAHTPVLVDDIISTARTMIETIGHLRRAKVRAPACIGVHAVFSGNAYEDLMAAGAADIVTCNSIPHPSNRIDLTPMLVEGINTLLGTL